MLELPPRLRAGVLTIRWTLALLALTLPLLAPPAGAADFTRFAAACATAKTFLLHDAAAGSDGGAALHILCPCLQSGFARYTQAEVDALTADLRTGSSYEAKATYPAYAGLQAKASVVLEACFNTDAVSAMKSFPTRPASGG